MPNHISQMHFPLHPAMSNKSISDLKKDAKNLEEILSNVNILVTGIT